MIEGLAACFAGLADPRATRRCDHRLIDTLVIAVCAVIACAESWEDIELYGRSKQAWLKSFLALPNGIPSHDTFRRVFMLLDPDAFEACFARWAQSLMGLGETGLTSGNPVNFAIGDAPWTPHRCTSITPPLRALELILHPA